MTECYLKENKLELNLIQKFIDWFNADLQTLLKQIIAFEDTNPIIYQQVTKKKNN